MSRSTTRFIPLVKHSVEKFNINADRHAYFFHRRGAKDNKKDWPHKDSSRYALIVYLSKTNLNSGTVFYNDKREVITDISFVNNRAILFNGQIPHKSKLNYGEDSDIRLTLNGFFMIRTDIFVNPIWEGDIQLNNKLLTHFFDKSKELNYIAHDKSSRNGSEQTQDLCVL